MIVISPQKKIDNYHSIVVIFTGHVDLSESELKFYIDLFPTLCMLESAIKLH